jgi:hypothetical protein
MLSKGKNRVERMQDTVNICQTECSTDFRCELRNHHAKLREAAWADHETQGTITWYSQQDRPEQKRHWRKVFMKAKLSAQQRISPARSVHCPGGSRGIKNKGFESPEISQETRMKDAQAISLLEQACCKRNPEPYLPIPPSERRRGQSVRTTGNRRRDGDAAQSGVQGKGLTPCAGA